MAVAAAFVIVVLTVLIVLIVRPAIGNDDDDDDGDGDESVGRQKYLVQQKCDRFEFVILRYAVCRTIVVVVRKIRTQ